MRTLKSAFALILATLLAAGAAAQPASTLTRIGAAAAVSGAVNAAAPGAAGRVVQSGQPIYLNDHVTTDAKGRLQVLLLDETVFTLGPNSDMVLDEFVYDPATSAGKVTAKVTKGVFRFVTGKVARKNPSSMKVNLPVGTIGIRGTMGLGQIIGKVSTVILGGPGAKNNTGDPPGGVTVGNAGSSVNLDKPGYGTTVAEGRGPTMPTNMSAQAAQISNSLQPAPPEKKSDSPAGGGGSSTKSEPSKSDDSSKTETKTTASEPAKTADSTPVGDTAGQTTASGGASAGDIGILAALSADLGLTSVIATQDSTKADAIADGIATWDNVRSVQTGSGAYTFVGSGTCSGGVCSSPLTISGHLDIDFGYRTVGSAGCSPLGIYGGSFSDSTNVNTISFESLAGNAVITLQGGVNNSNSYFNGTTLTLMNAGGVAATSVNVNLTYSNSSSGVQGSGTATGDYVTPHPPM